MPNSSNAVECAPAARTGKTIGFGSSQQVFHVARPGAAASCRKPQVPYFVRLSEAEMTRSGYDRHARTLPRQPEDDPRRHLDARMNELLDELCKIPTISAESVEPHPLAPNGGLEAAARSSQQDRDRLHAQKMHGRGSDRALTAARALGPKQDRPSPAPSVAALTSHAGTQAERARAH